MEYEVLLSECIPKVFVIQVAKSDIYICKSFSRAKDSLKEIVIRQLDQQHCKLNVVTEVFISVLSFQRASSQEFLLL